MIGLPTWKKARGDHIVTAAIITSIVMTIIIAVTIFGDINGYLSLCWVVGSMFAGVVIPLYLAPVEWIDYEGKIPPRTFWKELLS